MTVIKFKKLHSDAVEPFRANPWDAGWDLTTTSHDWDIDYQTMTYRTGIAIEIPEGFVGLLFPRSSIYKKDLRLTNSVGVIDAGYRGEIMFKFNITREDNADLYMPGDRLGQLVIVPILDCFFSEVNELSSSDRGKGGFGSSGDQLVDQLNK